MLKVRHKSRSRQEVALARSGSQSVRILAVGVALVVPLLLAVAVLLARLQASLRLTERELAGLRFHAPLYGTLSRFEQDELSLDEPAPERALVALRTERDVQDLLLIADQQAAHVDLRDIAARVDQEWRSARGVGQRGSLEAAIQAVLLGNGQLASRAGFNADADPVVSTLNDVVTVQYPAMMRSVAQTAAVFGGEHAPPSSQQRFMATTFEADARSAEGNVLEDLRVLAVTHRSISERLQPLTARLSEEMATFSTVANRQILGQASAANARGLIAADTRLRVSLQREQSQLTEVMAADLQDREGEIRRHAFFIALAFVAVVAIGGLLLRIVALSFLRYQRQMLALARVEAESLRLQLAHERARDELAKSEVRFRAVFDGSTVGIAIVDLEGKTLEQNQALTELFGVFDIERMGFDSGELAALFAGSCERLFAELSVGVDRNERRWFSANISSVRDDGERRRFALIIVVDITERRRMEERLRFEAKHDALTGLPNRVAFFALLEPRARTLERRSLGRDVRRPRPLQARERWRRPRRRRSRPSTNRATHARRSSSR